MNENLGNMNQTNDSKKSTSNILIIILIVLVLVLIGLVTFMLLTKKDDNTNNGGNTENNTETNIPDKTPSNNEVSNGELDINSDLVQILAKQFEIYNYSNKKFTNDILSDNKYMLGHIILNLKDSVTELCEDIECGDREDEMYKINGKTYQMSLDADKVKSEFKKTYGKNVNYKNETAKIESYIADCGVTLYYDSKTNKYYGENQCGGDSGEYHYFELEKAIKSDDEIKLYFSNYEVDINEEAVIISGNKKYNTGISTNPYKDETSKNIENKIKQLKEENKIEIVEITFKNDNGNYYIVIK